MREFMWGVVVTIGLVMPAQAIGQTDQSQNSFLRSCSSSMTKPPQGLPRVLAANICKCAGQRITRNAASRLMLKVAADTHDYSAFESDVKMCVNQELPRYMRAHPQFLKQYLRAHPDLLK